jgi:hypothetical protein
MLFPFLFNTNASRPSKQVVRQALIAGRMPMIG